MLGYFFWYTAYNHWTLNIVHIYNHINSCKHLCPKNEQKRVTKYNIQYIIILYELQSLYNMPPTPVPMHAVKGIISWKVNLLVVYQSILMQNNFDDSCVRYRCVSSRVHHELSDNYFEFFLFAFWQVIIFCWRSWTQARLSSEKY